jgi:hypothetical protein
LIVEKRGLIKEATGKVASDKFGTTGELKCMKLWESRKPGFKRLEH